MLTYMIYALCACALWGLVFVIPGLLVGFTALEVAVGRCFVFGIFSLGIFLSQRNRMLGSLSKEVWTKALQLSFVANLIHYVALVLSMIYGNAMLSILILGVNPVTVAWYGNLKHREQRISSLLVPSLFIIAGLLTIHIEIFNQSVSLREHLWGMIFAALALITWTWFIVANAEFLKGHKVMVHDWVTVVGIATLFWACCSVAGVLLVQSILDFENNPLGFKGELPVLVMGSLVLGLGSSWGAQYFWNMATLRLPISLSGQLIVFESLFGLLYIFLLESRFPTALDFIGIALILSGVTIAIQKQRKIADLNSNITN